MRKPRRFWRRYRRLIKRIIFLLLIIFAVKQIKKHNLHIDALKSINTKLDNQININDLKSMVDTKENMDKLENMVDILDKDSLFSLYDILSNKEEYPEELIDLIFRNPETIDFVSSYSERDKFLNKRITKEESVELNRKYPLYLQWDKRWGYEEYGDSIIGLAGCAPTSMAMAISGLKNNSLVTPDIMAKASYDGGFVSVDNFTSWEFMTEGCKKFGIIGNEIPLDENKMKRELSKGRPLIISVKEGDFTSVGHMLLVVGIDKDDNFIINDSNSIERSKKSWSYERIKDQIRNIWSYTLE